MTEQRLSAIEAQLVRVTLMLENLTEKVDERSDVLETQSASMQKTVYGDGNGNKGHTLRIDRLEQTADRNKWAVRTLSAAMMGVLAKTVWGLLGTGPH